MDRLYFQLILGKLKKYRQMAFIAGPRQVGKTTLVKQLLKTSDNSLYLNWDIPADRQKILAFYQNSTPIINLDTPSNSKPIIAFDEIHKFKDWKNFLKGFYDLHSEHLSIIVTGSAKLNVYQKGGDSLMGRYFLYRIHPISLSEAHHHFPSQELLPPPTPTKKSTLDTLLHFGGFPDPFLSQDPAFLAQWQNLRHQQLFKEDIRELSRIYDIAQMELLAQILTQQATGQVNYSTLANKIQTSDNTIRQWIQTLEHLYFCFRITPYSTNIARSLLKEPKLYLYDWSNVPDPGPRIENLTACHLLKACHFWTDSGLGTFKLHYIRTKDKKEIDFLITQNNTPFLLTEVKSSQSAPLNPHLATFQKTLNAPHALQVAYDLEPNNLDFRAFNSPKTLPLTTFLSQLP